MVGALDWVESLSSAGFGLVPESAAPFTCVGGGDNCLPPAIPSPSYVSRLRDLDLPAAFINFSCTCVFTGATPAQQISEEAAMQRLLMDVRLLNWIAFSPHGFLIDFALILIAKAGPQAVVVNALPWKSYLGGIIRHNCDENPNHAVQVIGFGSETMQGCGGPGGFFSPEVIF